MSGYIVYESGGTCTPEGQNMLEMPIDKLNRLYYSGGMPAPLTKEGYYDIDTHEKIMNRIRRGY